VYNNDDGFHYYKHNGTQQLLRTRTNALFAALYLTVWGRHLTSFLGVTGLSVLILVNLFDYIRDCVVDPMHNIFLHVVPNFMNLWFSDEYKVKLQTICFHTNNAKRTSLGHYGVC
jgi:hypothetical protein